MTAPSIARGLRTLLDAFVESQHAIRRVAASADADSLDNKEAWATEQFHKWFPDITGELPAAVARFFVKTVGTTTDQELRAEISSLFDVARQDGHDLDSLLEMLRDPAARHKIVSDSSVVFSGQLIALTSNFETLLAGIARLYANAHPRGLISGDRKFSFEDVVAYGSLEDFRAGVVDEAVESTIRRGPDGAVRHLLSKMGIEVSVDVLSSELREVFERRNLWAHHNGYASRNYVKIAPAVNVGERVPVTREYIYEAADLTMIASFHVAWAFGCKFVKDEAELASFQGYMANVGYRMLLDRRYSVVEGITHDKLRASCVSDSTALVMQVNWWLSQKETDRFEGCRAEVEQWQTSHLSPEYRLAKLALLGHLDEALELARSIRGTEGFPLWHYQSWPLLRHVREHEAELSAKELGD